MSEPKNIERIYQEAFNSFEVKPSAAVWNAIQTDLGKNKKKKGGLVLWILGATALFFIGFLVFNITTNNEITTVDHTNTTAKRQTSQATIPATFPDVVPDNLSFDKSIAASTYFNKNTFDFTLNNNFSTNLFQLNDYKFVFNSSSLAVSSQKEIVTKESNTIKKPLQETIAKETVAPIKKWAITPYVSQTYFNSISRGSPLDVSLVNNKKEFETSKTYGFELSRNISKKWTLNTGLSLLNLNYSTLNIAYRNEMNASSRLRGVAYNRYNQYTSVRDMDNNPAMAWNEQKGRIRQEISYIEVPFSVSYDFKKGKKMDISLTGGLSSLILTKNELTLHSLDGEERYFGKANNLSPINASANLSLGFNYHLGKTLNLNIKPSFRYYLDMFDQNSGNFKPYSVGVATGLNIRF